jgi:hypothetical protein
MNQTSEVAAPVKPMVPLWDVLLHIRQDILSRASGPYLHIGMPNVEWVTCFVLGYGECLRAGGVREGTDVLFGEWFRDVKKAWPGQGWGPAYLQEFHGDQTRALLKYLDYVAEFRELSPEALASIPWYAQGQHPATMTPTWVPAHRPKPTLDLLLEIRQEIGDVPGRLGLFIGAVDVRRMAGFIDGYRLCLALSGARDEEYARFEQWLHEAKDLPPGAAWPQFFLHVHGGDSEQAIRQLLGFAAEFRSV